MSLENAILMIAQEIDNDLDLEKGIFGKSPDWAKYSIYGYAHALRVALEAARQDPTDPSKSVNPVEVKYSESVKEVEEVEKFSGCKEKDGKTYKSGRLGYIAFSNIVKNQVIIKFLDNSHDFCLYTNKVKVFKRDSLSTSPAPFKVVSWQTMASWFPYWNENNKDIYVQLVFQSGCLDITEVYFQTEKFDESC